MAFNNPFNYGSVPQSLPVTYTKKDIILSTDSWVADKTLPIDTTVRYGSAASTEVKIADGDFSYLLPITAEKAAQWRADYNSGSVGATTAMTNINGAKMDSYDDRVTFYWEQSYGVCVVVKNTGLYAYGYANGGNFEKLSADVSKYHQTITDSDIIANCEVTIDLDESNGKLAGQVELQKEVSKSDGSLILTANSLPTSAIAGVMSIMNTSAEGAAVVRGILSGAATSLTLTAPNGDIYTVSVDNSGQIVLTKQQ